MIVKKIKRKSSIQHYITFGNSQWVIDDYLKDVVAEFEKKPCHSKGDIFLSKRIELKSPFPTFISQGKFKSVKDAKDYIKSRRWM